MWHFVGFTQTRPSSVFQKSPMIATSRFVAAHHSAESGSWNNHVSATEDDSMSTEPQSLNNEAPNWLAVEEFQVDYHHRDT